LADVSNPYHFGISLWGIVTWEFLGSLGEPPRAPGWPIKLLANCLEIGPQYSRPPQNGTAFNEAIETGQTHTLDVHNP